MDPGMYNAAREGNIEDGDFSLADHLKREEENGYQVTQNGNTILHVAAIFGQRGFVGEVLKVTPALLCYKNKKNETALHIAANIGQSEVMSELLSIEGRGEDNKEILVRMKDDIGDTALHKAVRSGHLDIVWILVKLLVDPELDFPANKDGETPLYLAAKSDFYDALIEILNVYKEPTYVVGPSNRTPLHAAVIQEHTVLVIGAGGLGSPALLYLAACGVGRIGIVDHDVVELNNLQRQIIHTEAYIGIHCTMLLSRIDTSSFRYVGVEEILSLPSRGQ